MRKSKLFFAAFAVVIASTAAFASKPKPVAPEYGYDQSTGMWILTRAQSHCTLDPTSNCEAQFNGDPNNGGTIVPGTLVKGDFVY